MFVDRVCAKRDPRHIEQFRMKTLPATQIGVSRGFSALILADRPTC